jgi:hypothetical protein
MAPELDPAKHILVHEGLVQRAHRPKDQIKKVNSPECLSRKKKHRAFQRLLASFLP